MSTLKIVVQAAKIRDLKAKITELEEELERAEIAVSHMFDDHRCNCTIKGFNDES